MAVARTIPTSQIPDVVTFTILSDGEEIPASVPIRNFIIQREVNKIPFAKISISDGDPSAETFPVSNEEYFIPGKEIEIRLGYRSDNSTLFKGLVIKHSNRISNLSAELNIECRDKAVKLTSGRKSRHYEDITDSDIAEELTDQYGLDKEIESSSVQHKELIQYNTTDWDFILSRIDLIGMICLVEDGKIIIKKPDLTSSPVLDLLFGATILDFTAEMDARNQYSEVKSLSWDYSNQEVIEDTGDEPEMENAGNISSADLADVIGLESYDLINSGKLSNEELKEFANSKMLKSRLSRIRGKVRFQGFPDVKPGDIISLNGVGDRFNGPVFASSVRHEFAAGNWTTEVIFGMSERWFAENIDQYNISAKDGRLPAVQGLETGIVTDLEDPEGENRVKVKLPVVSSSEDGIWMRIATLDAGSNRGTFFLPEIDDEVIVGFISNDPHHPVILGMLHSSAKPAPLTASNSNDEKGYVSRAQTKMIFDDGQKTLTIEDASGNKMKFESGGITIESSTVLNLKAASIKIEASGPTEIKGAVVKIN
ncbi:MAG: type VI secretion system tip protein VgrG [Ignavibacteriae bacterium]|nr:type VI secretion system tip protein VgrG [Ignavibacteriota bacterium]